MSTSALPPMPQDGPGPQDVSPTAPAAASPAPATPSPAMQQGTQMVISVVQGLRAIAKAFPSTADDVAQMNNLMRSVMAKMMSEGSTGEPMAPPNGG